MASTWRCKKTWPLYHDHSLFDHKDRDKNSQALINIFASVYYKMLWLNNNAKLVVVKFIYLNTFQKQREENCTRKTWTHTYICKNIIMTMEWKHLIFLYLALTGNKNFSSTNVSSIIGGLWIKCQNSKDIFRGENTKFIRIHVST